MSKPNNATCQICGSRTRLHPASLIRPAIAELIARAKPGWDPHGWICENDVQHFRGDYVRSLLTDEQGEVNALVEVLPRLAVSCDHLVGHEGRQQGPELVLEGLIIGRQFDAGEVHAPSVTLSSRSVKSL